MHGDSLCIDDIGYMRMRRWLRNPLSLFILRHLPLTARHRIGRKLRNERQTRTRYKALEITDVNQDEALRVMRAQRVTPLIHGHSHRPAVHAVELDGREAERSVLVAGDEAGGALEVDEQGYRLESFELG